MSEFNFEDTIRMRKQQYPNLKEITVHPPLSNYNLEMVVCKDIKLVEEQLKKLVQLSEELNIETNMIFHTYWTKNQYIATGLANKLKELLIQLAIINDIKESNEFAEYIQKKKMNLEKNIKYF